MSSNEAALEAESQTALIYSLCITLVTISTLSVGLRLYTRTRILKIVGSDDFAIVVAQILAIAVSIATILEAKWGLGRHTQFVSEESMIRQLRCLYSVVLIYNPAQIITKISFLIHYRRLFPGPRTQQVCFWLLIFIVFWGVVQEFILAFGCIPLSLIIPSMTGKCLYTLPIWYTTSSMNIVTDFAIFIVPIPSVLELQMQTRKKVLLCGLFGLGFLQVTCIISVIRLFTLYHSVKTTDPSWDNAPTAYWTIIELNCGILCACLPTLRPLLAKSLPRFGTTWSGSRSNTGVSHNLSTRQRKSRAGAKDGIYVQTEVELHSTTELRTHASGSSEET
ncbi:hypothetical protein K458DRAFT_476511, partial [Lentithecium fluviatile CBS 122367]